jgi:hypothetical protein
VTDDPFFEDEPRWTPGSGDPLGVLSVEHRRDHKFVKREKMGCGYEVGGKQCGAGKTRMIHNGVPPSINVFGSGANRFSYMNAKKGWEAVLGELLTKAGLPKGLGRVYAEAVMGFPTRQRRDQGNYRYILEKALGDTLTSGGWLEDDDWSRYEFGRIQARYEKGQQWTQVIIQPFWPEEAAPAMEEVTHGQGTLL